MDCTEMKVLCVWRFLCGSHALFIRPTSTDFSKFFFKTGSHGTIHTFKNYFTTVFSVFSFQFSATSGIQTYSKRNILLIVFLHNKNNRSITCDYALINYKCGYLFIYLFNCYNK